MTPTDDSNQSWQTDLHDRLHAYPADEPLWTETMWFSWMVPERKLFGYVYPVYRPNLGILFGGVLVFDHTSVLPWEWPIMHWHQHLPLPTPPDLRDVAFPNGIRIRAVNPGRTFDIGYQSKELDLELRFEALMQPLISGDQADVFRKGGHLDQFGHVTGRMRMHGEDIAVDCYSIRDRGWGPRRDRTQIKVGYAYGIASAQSAFLMVAQPKRGGGEMVWGFLMRDGVWAKLASGTRRAERNAEGRIQKLFLEASDEHGREMRVTGEMLSHMAFTPYPSMLNWSSLARWQFDGQECWGEDQDVWSPAEWRKFASTLPGRTGENK